MLKYVDYDIVFQEIPDQVTLAVNLSLCPNRCAGCHSPQLRENIGEELTAEVVLALLKQYEGSVTCLCLMGGDNDPTEVERLCRLVRSRTGIRTGWYSGREELPTGFDPTALDFIKLGPYVASLGGLRSPLSNQRLWHVESDGTMRDLTPRFRQKQNPDTPQIAECPDYRDNTLSPTGCLHAAQDTPSGIAKQDHDTREDRRILYHQPARTR